MGAARAGVSLVRMARFDIHDIKNQASLFFREKVKDARLAFTNVSRIQLLTEEATNADPWGPETRTMALLSNAAFDLEEYQRIVQILHDRLEPNAKGSWRQLYKVLTLLEYLITHGPRSLSNEFRDDIFCIEELCQYNFIDQQGIDRGLSVRKKADRVLELLSKADLWNEERNHAQRISHSIHGFGSSVEKAQVLIKSAEHHQARSDVVEPEDAESQTLLSNESSKEEIDVLTELPGMDPGGEWKPFEKCASTPSYLRHNDGNSATHDDVRQKRVFETPCSPFKRSLSSPHFRDPVHFIWQPFAEDISKGCDIGRQITEPIEGTLQTSNDGDKEGPSLDRFSGAHLLEIPKLEKAAPPSHRSMRQRLGFHRPHKDVPKGNSTDVQQHALPEPAITGSSLMNESAGIDEFVLSEDNKSSQQYEAAAQNSSSSSNIPVLPPPPRPKFRTKFQRHWRPSSLIDL